MAQPIDQADNAGIAVLPPDARVAGKSMDFWTGEWWTRLMASDAQDNIVQSGPGNIDIGDAGDYGKVVFLVGFFNFSESSV